MEWNRLAVEGLIEAYREENCLYNTKSPNYHNKHYRKEALERITNVLKDVRPSTTGVDIMAKMKSLRTSFVAELNKIKQSTKSGAGSGQIYKPTIWYFEKLQFLRVEACKTQLFSRRAPDASIASLAAVECK